MADASAPGPASGVGRGTLLLADPALSDAADDLEVADWVEDNVREVTEATEATDGRVTYVYVPDTVRSGPHYFTRYFWLHALLASGGRRLGRRERGRPA